MSHQKHDRRRERGDKGYETQGTREDMSGFVTKEKKMNPMAVAMIVLGVVLYLFGALLALRGRKARGIAILVLGVGVAAVPFLVSFTLAR